MRNPIISKRSFDKAFKTAAVKLIIEESFSVKEVIVQLDVHANSLYCWVQEVEKYGDSAFPGKGSALFDARHEIKKLEQENRYLREEIELLKKFRVFLKTKRKIRFQFLKDNKETVNIHRACQTLNISKMEQFELRKS